LKRNEERSLRVWVCALHVPVSVHPLAKRRSSLNLAVGRKVIVKVSVNYMMAVGKGVKPLAMWRRNMRVAASKKTVFLAALEEAKDGGKVGSLHKGCQSLKSR